MAVIIGRHINGVAINPLEYVLGKDGEPTQFATRKDAESFLQSHGIHDFEGLVFVDENK